MPCSPGEANLNLGDCFFLNDSQAVSSVYNQPTTLIELIVRYSFIAAGLIIFFLIFYCAFLFLTGGVKGKEKAAEIGQSALIGFIVMFSAYWIVQIIQVITGANIKI